MPLYVTNSVTGETTIVDGSGATISGSKGKATIGSGSITVSGSDGAVSTFGSGSLTVSGSGGHTTYGSGSLSGAFGFAITGSLAVSGSNTITNYGSFVSNEAGEDFDFRVESNNNANMLFVDGGNDAVGIGTSAPEAYLDIKNTVDDGATNRTMLRLHNYRDDDADVNDFGPISIDFEVENVPSGGSKSGLARIAAVQSPVGTDHATPGGEKSSGLIFSTMAGNTLAEAMRINASGNVGIGTTSPTTALDIHHDPTGLTNDTGGGEVVTFGTEDGTDALAAGKLMYLNASGVWKYTDADAPATGGSQLLAIALGGAVSDGLLLRGFFDMTTYLAGTFDQGVPVYVSVTASQGDVGIPGGSGDFVRVIGYCTDTANVIYFNPDGTYIEIA